MTSAELRDEAVKHLKKTTVGYINKKWTTPPAGTEWKQALDILAQIGAVVPPPPIGTKRGVAYMKWGNGESPPTHAVDYDSIFVGWGGVGAVGKLATRTGPYMSAVSCLEGAGWHYGVRGEDAVANGWVLKQGTRLLRNAGYTSSYIGDPGDPGYQQRWADNVITLMKGWGSEAVFIDDFYGSLSLCDGVPDKYPTRSTQRAACLAFAQYVYGRLHAEGFYVAWNCVVYEGEAGDDTGATTPPWWNMLAPYSDALCAEYWQWRDNSPSKIRKSGPEWYNNWDSWQVLPALCESLGKDFIPIHYATDPAHALYILCSTLLESPSRHSVTWIKEDGGDPWHPAYDRLPLGAALGAKVKNGNRWERQYAKGLVWVDPIAGTSGIN